MCWLGLLLGVEVVLLWLPVSIAQRVWNFFVDGCPGLMKGSVDLPLLEVAPESATMYKTNPLKVFSLVS